MFTQTHCQAASLNAMRTTFRRAAEAEARQQAATTQTVIGAPSSRLAEEAQREGRAAAAFASVLVSVALLGSVVIGLTSMGSPADMAEWSKSTPGCEALAGGG
jgi:hypothetical protein